MSKELKRPKRSDFGTKQDIQYKKSLNKYFDQIESKLKEAKEKEKTYEMIQHNYGELIKEKLQWKKKLKEAESLSNKRFYDKIRLSKKLKAVKDSLMSDEEIDKLYPERNSSGTHLDYNLARRESIKLQRERTKKALE
jgi:hypothetical protein